MPSAAAGRPAFEHPNFRLYLTARFLVIFSSEMQALAVAWQIYGITHRPLDLGFVGLAQFLPGMFLFLPAGHSADRFPRRNILLACYGGFALCSALLVTFAVRGLASVLPIYLVLVGNGVVRAFNGPASQAMLPLIVPEEVFPNAVAWGSSISQAAQVAGPMAGGLIYGATSHPLPVYAVSGALYFTALALMARVRPPSVERPRGNASIRTVLEGIRYIWRHPIILGAISLDLFAVLLGGAVALLPVYAREILRVGAYGLGVLRAGPGLGAVLMAIVVAHWPLRRGAGKAMLACVGLFGVCIVVFGLSRSLPLAMVALVTAGSADMVSVIVRHTLVQLGTPDEMRGRVSAVNMIFIGASNELGQFESGLTAQWLGTVPAVVAGGLGTIVVVLIWSILFPALRRVDALVSARPGKA